MNDTLKDFLKKVQELEIAARRLAEKNPRAFDTPGYREYQRGLYKPEDGPFIFSPERGWWSVSTGLSLIKKHIETAMETPSKGGRFMIEKKGNVFYLR